MAFREDLKMSGRRISSLTDNSRDLRKQIGCMNGIFQLFDRHQFLTGRRSSGHRHKRLLQGAQHQQDQQNTKSSMEKGLEMPKEKPRTSTESSRASYSSSTCSTSTYSAHDFSRIAQPEALPVKQIKIPESSFQMMAAKEQQPSSAKSMQSLDFRDVVKESVYREVHGLSVKSRASNERKGKVMKHIDSPRPSLQLDSEKPKARGYEGSARVPCKAQEGIRNAREERLALPRFSYDGRESRETVKWGGKHKEHPRLSLDSKTSSMKYSALESRSNFLVRDQTVEHQNFSEVLQSNQEPESHHHRSSSVVVKLMGLEEFPDAVSSCENSTPRLKPGHKEDFLPQLASTAGQSKLNQATYSPRVSHNNPASPSSRLPDTNSVRKPRFPTEPAPWRQQDGSQGSSRIPSQSRKAPTDAPRLSLSVYGEIEKRIAELEFKRSGKDLRALKQILAAMEKTRERLENKREESAEVTLQSVEGGYSGQNLSRQRDGSSYRQILINGPSAQRQSGSPVVIMKPAKMMDKVNLSYSTRIPASEMPQMRRLQTQERQYCRESSAHSQKAKDLSPKNNVKDSSRNPPSTGKRTTLRTSELDRTSTRTQHLTVENSTTPGRSSGTTSPRLQQSQLRTGLSRPATPLPDSIHAKKSRSKKLTDKGSQNRKTRAKAKDLQLSDDQLSELSSETRYSSYQGDTASVKSESNNSLVSLTETEIMNLAHSSNINGGQKKDYMSRTRKYLPAAESTITTVEQPSPISVLDDSFYCEDSPSPVKKTSTPFRGDIPSPGEADWHLEEDQKHLTECRRSDHTCKYSQKLEGMRDPIQELSSLHNKADEISVVRNALVHGNHNPDHRYINKVLLTSGLLKDWSFIAGTDQLISSYHLINPDMFHVLEQTEDPLEDFHGEVTDKNKKMNLDRRIRRKIIFDMVDEILVDKINSGRFAVGKKMTNPQLLLKEICIEMERAHQFSNSNFDDGEEDEITRLLTADMKHQWEDRVDYKGDVPALVLDVERLIFKDLITEVVTGEVTEVGGWPKRHHRQQPFRN